MDAASDGGVLSPAKLANGNRALVRLIGGWHALAANTVVIIAGVHAAAALFHHYILRDATLRRMLPWGLR